MPRNTKVRLTAAGKPDRRFGKKRVAVKRPRKARKTSKAKAYEGSAQFSQSTGQVGGQTDPAWAERERNRTREDRLYQLSSGAFITAIQVSGGAVPQGQDARQFVRIAREILSEMETPTARPVPIANAKRHPAMDPANASPVLDDDPFADDLSLIEEPALS